MSKFDGNIRLIAETIGVSEDFAKSNDHIRILAQNDHLVESIENANCMGDHAVGKYKFSNAEFLDRFNAIKTEISSDEDGVKCLKFKAFCDREKDQFDACKKYPLKDVLRDCRALPKISSSYQQSPGRVETYLDNLYDNFNSRLDGIDSSQTAIVISGEIHGIPATYVAQRLLLQAAHERGFRNVVIEYSPEDIPFNEVVASELRNPPPFLISCPTGPRLSDDPDRLCARTKDINALRMYQHALDIGYRITPGDTTEFDSAEAYARFNADPTAELKAKVYEERNLSMAGAADKTQAQCVILVGANHLKGIHEYFEHQGKRVISFSLTPLALPEVVGRDEIALESAKQKHDEATVDRLTRRMDLTQHERDFYQAHPIMETPPEIVQDLAHLMPDEIDQHVRETHSRFVQRKQAVQAVTDAGILERAASAAPTHQFHQQTEGIITGSSLPGTATNTSQNVLVPPPSSDIPQQQVQIASLPSNVPLLIHRTAIIPSNIAPISPTPSLPASGHHTSTDEPEEQPLLGDGKKNRCCNIL